LQRFEYDGLSRLTLSFDNNDPDDTLDDQPVKFACDSLSRLLEEVQCEFPVSSRWAGDNNRVGLVYPNGRTIEMTFDKLDRIDTISDASRLASAEQFPIVDYDYIGQDRVLERTYDNGVRLTHLNDDRTQASGYDAVKRLVSHRHFNKQGSLIAGSDYSYDRVSNRLSEKESQGDKQVRAESYKYDSEYRLTEFNRDGKDKDDWQLDGVGNWAKRRGLINEVNNMNEYTVFGRSKGTTAGATAGIPSQTGNAQLSDDNGNLLDDGTNQYEYDSANRLRRVTRKSDRAIVAVYSYDATNRRFKAFVTNSRSESGYFNDRVLYFYDGWREIEENRVGPLQQLIGPTQQYVYGLWIDEPLMLDIDANNDGRIEPSDTVGDGDSDRFDQVAKDKRFFYHEDGKRYISALTDNRGAVVEQYKYDAYGVPTITDAAGAKRNQSAVNNRYLFNARRFDPESGLYYYRNRYMNPEQGRFIHRDPIETWADETNLGNAYAYVENNPLNNYDPYGEFSLNPVKAIKSGAGWVGGKAKSGAKWAAGKAESGAKWIAGKAVSRAKWVGGKAGSVAKWFQDPEFPIYGNYCGPGHGDTQYVLEPIDDVDRACMKHDMCYDRRHYLACECDQQLVGDVWLALQTTESAEEKAAGSAILTYFILQSALVSCWIP
jgi:RHS repeat-associated protein